MESLRFYTFSQKFNICKWGSESFPDLLKNDHEPANMRARSRFRATIE